MPLKKKLLGEASSQEVSLVAAVEIRVLSGHFYELRTSLFSGRGLVLQGSVLGSKLGLEKAVSNKVTVFADDRSSKDKVSCEKLQTDPVKLSKQTISDNTQEIQCRYVE